MIYAEDEEVFRETAVRELLKLGFLRQDARGFFWGGEPITGGKMSGM